MPTVSIGMPIHNAERYLPRALESLLGQEFGDLEVHISDNASTDNTPGICADYVKKDSRVAYHRQRTNLGQLRNFDIAASYATGRYFMWAADDDFWLPGFLGRVVEELDRHPETGLVMTAIRRVRNDTSELDIVNFSGDKNPIGLGRLRTFLALAGGYANKKRYHLFMYGLYRTDLVTNARHYSALTVPHPDRVFMSQFALGASWRYVDEILHERTVHEKSSTERLPNEAFSKMVLSDSWAYSKTVLSLAPFLMRSRLVPLSRWIQIPLAVVVMAWSYRGVLYRGPLPPPVRVFFDIARKAMRLFR